MPTPDLPPAPAASLEAGLDAWQGIHQAVLARMCDLAQALDRHDHPQAERACRWIHGHLDGHLRWEEREMFPRLAAAGAPGLAGILRADHREMIRLAALALSLDPGDSRHPGEPARRLLDLVRHHVDTEQHRVLPLLQGRRPYEPPPGAGYHTPPRA